jgi:type II secretory pathway component PulF
MKMGERFKASIPFLIAFLVGTAIFSFTSGNIWWLVAAIICISVIYLLQRKREE